MMTEKSKKAPGKAPAASRSRPRGRPRQVPLEEQRERILAAATEVFVTEGFDGATSERIAEVSGVGRPSVYQLFGSKNDVFIAAVERAILRMVDLASRSLTKSAHLEGRKQTEANVSAYLELIAAEPNTLRMILLADSSGNADTREAAKTLRRGMQQSIAAYLRSVWGAFRALDPNDAELAAVLIASSAESAAVYHLERPDRSTAEIVRFVAYYIWSGVYDLAEEPKNPRLKQAAKS